MLDDLFDLVFTVIAFLLLIVLVQSLLIGSVSERDSSAILKAKDVTESFDLVVEGRSLYEKEQNVNINELKRQLKDIKEIGFVSSPDSEADAPGVGGI